MLTTSYITSYSSHPTQQPLSVPICSDAVRKTKIFFRTKFLSYELHLNTTITFTIIYYDPFIQYIFSQQCLTTLVMIAKLTPQNIDNLV